MSETRTISCDAEGCKVQKGESNHWWQITHIKADEMLGYLVIAHFNHPSLVVSGASPSGLASRKQEQQYDVCGESHLHEKISQLLKEIG